MPWLIGFVDLLGTHAGFLLPVFVAPGGGNGLLVQDFSPDGTVSAFRPLEEGDAPSRVAPCRDQVARQIGDPGLWAFAIDDEVLHGSEAELRPRLLSCLEAGRFDDKPFLKFEVASFCENEAAILAASKDAYASLRATSAWGARVWRDATIILPRARRVLHGIMRSTGLKIAREELDDVVVTGDDTRIRIGLSTKTAAKRIAQDALEKAIVQALAPIAEALGVTQVTTYVRTVPGARARYEPRPTGVVRGFGGIGLETLGVRVSEAQAWPGRAIVTAVEPTHSIDPLFGFCVAPERIEHIEAMGALAREWSARGLISVAIVARSTAFGAAERNQNPMRALDKVHDRFDYVVSVANHTLERLGGRAPESQARRRAASFARAAITGFLDVAESLRATSRASFLHRVPNQGFVLVGRSGLREGEDDEAVMAAMASMIHENLSLQGASLAYLALSKQIRPQTGLRFAGIPTPIVIARARGGRPGVRCLAFGVQPDRQTSATELFRRFCRTLIESRGWQIDPALAPDTVVLEAQRSGERAMFATASASDMTEVSATMDQLLAGEGEPIARVLVVPTAPPAAAQSLAQRQGISLIAYYDLGAWEAEVGLGRRRYEAIG